MVSLGDFKIFRSPHGLCLNITVGDIWCESCFKNKYCAHGCSHEKWRKSDRHTFELINIITPSLLHINECLSYIVTGLLLPAPLGWYRGSTPPMV